MIKLKRMIGSNRWIFALVAITIPWLPTILVACLATRYFTEGLVVWLVLLLFIILGLSGWLVVHFLEKLETWCDTVNGIWKYNRW